MTSQQDRPPNERAEEVSVYHGIMIHLNELGVEVLLTEVNNKGKDRETIGNVTREHQWPRGTLGWPRMIKLRLNAADRYQEAWLG
jgi:hypothetical protein